MNDIADKLTELLNDPSGMERLKKTAEELFSRSDSGEANNVEADGSPLPDIDPSMLSALVKGLGSGSDSRSELLLALKPHLSADRQKRVDNAVRLLKLIPLLPMLKQFI